MSVLLSYSELGVNFRHKVLVFIDSAITDFAFFLMHSSTVNFYTL